MEINKTEPILDTNNISYSLLPIKYIDLWDLYKKHLASYWVVEEVDMTNDANDWEKLTKNEKYFLCNILAFFSNADSLVNKNLALNFSNEVTINEARCFYSAQSLMENVHAEMYGLLIDTYIKDIDEKNRLFNAIKELPIVSEKVNWALKWIGLEEDKKPFADRLIAFAAIEGIFFCGSFCAIYWLKKRNILKGLCFSNELISRDEALHTKFACVLYSHLKYVENGDQKAKEIIMEAVEIEKKFICLSIPVDLIGMNKNLMSEYIEFCADALMLNLGYKKIYNKENPFAFMKMLNIEGKTNFFEKKVSEYSKYSSNQVVNFDSLDF